MATPTWQTRPVPPPGGAQQPAVPVPQSYWGAPGTNNNQIPPPRPPYGPPSGPPSGSQPSSYMQSSAPQPYRSPAQMTTSGPPNQPPPPVPPGSSPAMLQSGPYAPLPMPAYGPPMGIFQGNRWQPPAPGSTPTMPSAPGVVRSSTESPLLNQHPSMPQSGPAPVASQPGPPPASAPLTQPPHYQTYPGGPVPQSMGPWMPAPQQAAQMQQRPPYANFPSCYPMPYASHRHVGLSQDISGVKATPQDSGPYGSAGDPSLAPGIGNQTVKAWGHAPYSGTSSGPVATKDASLAANGKPAGSESNVTKTVASVSGVDRASQESSDKDTQDVFAASAPDAWTAHKTADGAVYYYNSVTGRSTYDKPPGFTGEAEKVTAQPTPVSWERLSGTDWALVTTNDGKKYYYNTRSQATSWQVPSEVAELRRKQAAEAPSKTSMEVVAPGTSAEKSIVSFSLNIPAAATGGREAIGHKGLAVNSALDLIKKKLQDPGAPTASSPLPPGTGTATVISHSILESTTGKVDNSKEKPKGINLDSVSSDSSSDSDEEDPGPTKEERIAQFKEMLKEKGIAPFSKWEKELPKIIFDVRFKAIPSHTERRTIFEHYVRTRADEERKEKRAAQKAAVEGFKQLLEEAAKDLSYHTTFENFARTWGQDPRFEALERKDREALLNERHVWDSKVMNPVPLCDSPRHNWLQYSGHGERTNLPFVRSQGTAIYVVAPRLLPLRKAEDERVKAEHAAAVGAFKVMLLERGDINTSSRWSKVREVVRNDPRYSAVKREEREGLFNAYIGELLSAEQEAERAAKAKREEEEKVKEREREMRKRKEREEQEMERVRAKARRKDAVTAYQALLTEKIKDPEASWTEARPKLEKEPLGRATNPELDLSDRERLFREHKNEIFDRYVREYRLLLADVITVEAAQKLAEEDKHILTSWSDAKKLLKPDPRYGKMPRRDRESWWRRYAEDLQRRMKAAASGATKDDKPVSVNGAKTGLASESSLRSPGSRRNASRR